MHKVWHFHDTQMYLILIYEQATVCRARLASARVNHVAAPYHQLVSLRLVGLGLRDVPTAIGQHLWSLQSLSFARLVGSHTAKF